MKSVFWLSLFFIILIPSIIHSTEIPSLVFSEIMYDLDGSDSNREWVEVYNNGSESIEINGETSWRFFDGANHTLSLYQGDLIVEPNEFIILVDNPEAFLMDYPSFTGTIIDTVISLNNTEDTLSLSNDSGETYFTSVIYNSTWGASGNGFTLEKVDLLGSEESINWQENNLIGGSPGFFNQSNDDDEIEPPEETEDQAPIAEAGEDQIVLVNEEVYFDASSSFDPNNDPLTFNWDFGDNSTGEGVTTTHTYLEAESYTITLTVSDGELSDMDTLIIEVNNPVTIIESGPSNNQEEVIITFTNQIIINEILPNPLGPDSQLEFIELFNQSYSTIDLMGWSVQDNSSRVFVIEEGLFTLTEISPGGYFVITSQISGIGLNNSGGDQVKLYSPSGNQLDQIEYTASALENKSYARKSNNEWAWTGEPTPGEVNSFLGNIEPVADFVIDGNTFNLNQIVEFNASLSTDPDNDVLTYLWDFGDGSYGDEMIETHSYDVFGTYNIVLEVSDSSGLSDLKTKQVTILEDEVAEITHFEVPLGLRINEFMVNPVGSDDTEWIELFNSSSEIIDLSNIKLDDMEGGSKPYTLTDLLIQPFSYLLIDRSDSNLALNNTTDSVRLLDLNDNVIQEVVYNEVKENYSYAYSEILNNWFWTESISPGELNQLTALESFEISGYEENNNNLITTISGAKDLEKGDYVKTLGIVTVPPGILGKTVFYLSEYDNLTHDMYLTLGIEIYSSKGDFPDLKLGDVIELDGKVSIVSDKKRINLQKESVINILGNQELGEIELIGTGEINDELVGSLIRVSGELISLKSNNYYLDDGSGELKIYLKKETTMGKPKIEVGHILEVTGIVDLTKTGYRLLPRFNEDVKVGQVLGAKYELSDEVINLESDDEKSKIVRLIIYILITLSVLLISLFMKYKYLNKSDK